MKKSVWIAIIVGTLICGTGQVMAYDISGSWDARDDFKANIQFRQQGSSVNGTYPQDRGEIIGEMFGNRLQGFWIEDHSNRRCTIPVNGRYYWGNITIDYSGDRMTGVWGYCFDTPTRRFSGNRAGRSFSTPSSESLHVGGGWKTTEGDLFLNVSGDNVTGVYAKNKGEVMGRMRGNTLMGYWLQNSSGRRCSSPQNGHYYWGKIRFVFTGNKFQGAWGYCDDEPRQSWTGYR